MTLVEMMVVIAIVVLLGSLILPAIQKVRGAAHRTQCASNLRQIGIAAHHFDEDFHRLPPGYLGPPLSESTDYPRFYADGQWVGHLAMLLPYLEQDKLFSEIDVQFGPLQVTRPWFQIKTTGAYINGTNYAAARTPVKILKCPAAPRYVPKVGSRTEGTVLGLHVVHGSQGWITTVYTTEDYLGKGAEYKFLDATHYIGVAGTGTGTSPFWRTWEGIYTNRSQNSLGQVAVHDGTSNTLMYGEACASRVQGGAEYTTDISWMGAGALGTYRGLRRPRESDITTFTGYHPGGVHFCFADGSVRLLRFGDTAWDQRSQQSQDWFILQQLAGIRDGGTANTSSLVD
jgi:prepilin-type processing-associated H-X9-DG protein